VGSRETPEGRTGRRARGGSKRHREDRRENTGRSERAVDILSPLQYILPACSRYVPCALCVLSLYTIMWSERSERPAARAAVRAVRSGPLVVVIRCVGILRHLRVCERSTREREREVKR
jgi:hypothetical protein